MPSYYEALPIYKVAMDGGRLRETTLDVVMLIARCKRRAQQARQIPLLCDRIEELKLYKRSRNECSQMPFSRGGRGRRRPDDLRPRRCAGWAIHHHKWNRVRRQD
jgi:hypothetical protein